MTINEFLIKKIPASGKMVVLFIKEKRVFINKLSARQQQVISAEDLIVLDDKILQTPTPFFYIAYYKPRGIECTMNKDIPNNLLLALPALKGFFPVGRLDKDSEGLLILTNDGDLYKKIAPSDVLKEKEYEVSVEKKISDEALHNLSEGIVIMGKKTRPSVVSRIDDYSFRIVLTQGLNRQIRRMCYKLGYAVNSLKRVRIMSLTLDNLSPGEYKKIRKEDILT